jgi:hypothetical protein
MDIMQKLRKERHSTIQKPLFIFAILWLLFLSVKQSSRNLVESGSTLIISPLVNLPNRRMCSIWFTTQDKKSNFTYQMIAIDMVFVSKSHAKITSHTFMLILLAGDIATNPGPQASNGYNIQCIYLNARSLINKTNELIQTLAIDIDLLAMTETWLKPENLDSEILPVKDFNIHRRDRTNRIGGGVLLAVRENIPSMRRQDLESSAEMLVCELRPEWKKKIAVLFSTDHQTRI